MLLQTGHPPRGPWVVSGLHRKPSTQQVRPPSPRSSAGGAAPGDWISGGFLPPARRHWLCLEASYEVWSMTTTCSPHGGRDLGASQRCLGDRPWERCL